MVLGTEQDSAKLGALDRPSGRQGEWRVSVETIDLRAWIGGRDLQRHLGVSGGIADRQRIVVEEEPAPIGLDDSFPSQTEPIEMRLVDVKQSERPTRLRRCLAVVDILRGEPELFDTRRATSSMASGAKSAYQAGAAASGGSGVRAAGAGLANVAKSGAGAVGQRVAAGAKAVKDRVANFVAEAAAPAAAAGSPESAEAKPPAGEPAWAKQMRRKQQASHAVSTAAHTLRSGDHGGSGASPSLRDDSNT